MKLSVALVGYGLSGKVFHGPLLKVHKNFEVVSVVSSRVDEIKDDFPNAITCDFDHAVEQSDLVVISTPHQLHFEQTKMALEAGKHVVVEKPFTSTLEQANELFELAQKKQRTLAVFHNRRFDADFLTLKKIVDQKVIGEVVTIESHFDRFRPEPNVGAWREQKGEQSGVWWDLGPHLIDQAKQLMGIPESVDYDIGQQRSGEADDFFNVTLKYAKGRRVHLRASCIVKDFGFRWRVHGTKGSVLFKSLDYQEGQLRAGMNADDPGLGLYPQGDFKLAANSIVKLETGRYISFYDEVYESITNRLPFFVTQEDVVFTTSLLLGKKTF